jgi:predicted Rossmann-fold nucleotide-binding protein
MRVFRNLIRPFERLHRDDTPSRLHRPLVVAVVGGDQTGQASNARLVGSAIARARHIVLTGHVARSESDAVSESAPQAALEAAGRTISIVPFYGYRCGSEPRPPWSIDVTPDGRSLIVQTNMCSEERDCTNGVTADVLVALEGGTGTLTEIACALLARKPVLLFDSKQQLRSKYRCHRHDGGDGKLLEFLLKVVRVYPTVEGTTVEPAAVESLLADSLDRATEVKRIHHLIDAVHKAVSTCDIPPVPSFPGLPREYEATRLCFGACFRRLIGDG